RNPSFVRAMPAAGGILFTARMLKGIRRLGGKARMARVTPKQRSGLARKAALARWQKREKEAGKQKNPQKKERKRGRPQRMKVGALLSTEATASSFYFLISQIVGGFDK